MTTATLRVTFDVAGAVVAYPNPAVITLPYSVALPELVTAATPTATPSRFSLVVYAVDYESMQRRSARARIVFSVIGPISTKMRASFDVMESLSILRRRGIRPIEAVTIPGSSFSGIVTFIIKSSGQTVAAGAVEFPSASGVELRWDGMHFANSDVYSLVGGVESLLGSSTERYFRHA